MWNFIDVMPGISQLCCNHIWLLFWDYRKKVMLFRYDDPPSLYFKMYFIG